MNSVDRMLHDSDEKYRTLFENAADGILLMSADGKTFVSNKAFARMHGYTVEEISGMRLSDLDAPETARLAPERLRQLLDRKTLTFEVEHYHKDGHVFPLSVTCSVIRVDGQPFFQGFHQDLSERKRAEEALKNAQRLESIGVLAGGIAHDFNNLLMGILGNVELVSTRIADEKALEFLQAIEENINRAKALSTQLLTFAKGGKPVRNTGRIQPCLRSTAEFALSGSNVSCLFDLPDDLWPCLFDGNQIGQVIENLVINAKQAMPEGGTVVISAANVSLREGDVPLLSEGDYIKISIKDRGVGISRDVVGRIFDPYFTTKQTGSGLGLAVSFSIIKKHNGHIAVESAPGEGSVFHVFIPAWRDAVEDVVERPLRAEKGMGRILLMDDMEAIRAVLEQGLAGAGYSVTATKDGREALERFRLGLEEGKPFSAVVLDLTIPGGMGGRETARELRKLDATVPVFVASGYSEDPVLSDPKEFGFTAGIGKPFVLSEIIGLLNRHLHGAERT
ncbi:MAG: PAS domain S-box protein [Proteobacteria bacterium]|jgi:PAS domain S-box-containing protein|nr:PAS domain S-box protein [Pseudomonadota bacterium]